MYGYMSVEDMVEELSTKYDAKYSRMYDLMTTTSWRLIKKRPSEYLLDSRARHEAAYLISDRYMSIKKYEEKNNLVTTVG